MSKRKDRDICFLHVIVEECPGQVRNINSDGMKIFLLAHPPIHENEEYDFKIIPDESLGIKLFSIKGIVRWKKEDTHGTNFGIELNKRELARMGETLEFLTKI